MSKHIGIRHKGVPSISEILYFDEIAIVSGPFTAKSYAATSDWLKIHGVNEEIPYRIEEYERSEHEYLELLANKNIVVDFAKFLTRPNAIQSYNLAKQESDAFALDAIKILLKSVKDIGKSTATVPLHLASPKLYRFVADMTILPLRRAIEAWPEYLPTTIYTDSIYQATSNSHNSVLEVVLKSIPSPTHDNSIHSILDFRSNSDAMLSLRRLRRWMSQISQKKLSPNEIEDELTDLIDKYTEYMKFHNLKYIAGTYQTVFSISMDILDNILKLRFKPAFESLFAFRAQRIALTEAELKAPGREAAYIVNANSKLQVTKKPT
jgi:hypothetical protein